MGITPITFGKRTQTTQTRLRLLRPVALWSLITISAFKATPKRLREQLAEGASVRGERHEVTQALSKPLVCDGESDALLCLCGLCFF